ncbi:Phosphate transport system permease protein pstA [Kluyvera cryocrescens]|uniref:Phosphate transport system permease protein pstA n=1 Tax=Kluyvera cryocrescens TaxID=580 RepID=A0A485BF47_KLUCR|nr:Phosphate transport system permease protein pstA [Kluyvera cryocrescens]
MTTLEMQNTAELAESRRKMQARRRMKNRIALTLSMATMIFGLFWLVWILMATITRGIDGMSLALFTEMTPPPNTAGGGLANALAGSGPADSVGDRVWYAAGHNGGYLPCRVWA